LNCFKRKCKLEVVEQEKQKLVGKAEHVSRADYLVQVVTGGLTTWPRWLQQDWLPGPGGYRRTDYLAQVVTGGLTTCSRWLQEDWLPGPGGYSRTDYLVELPG